MLMTRDKSFYKSFFGLYWALVLQNVIVLSVNLADNIMLGGYSETALSGVAAVNQIQFILQQVTAGVGDGLVVLASQYWGQQRLDPIRRLTNIALAAGLGFAGLLFILVSFFPAGAVGLFTSDAAIIAEGVSYLSIIRFTYPIFALTTVLLASLRSVETVKIAFYVSISTLIINCCINYVLIYGKFGAPRMGAKGAAIGTLCARAVELCIVGLYVLFKEKKLRFTLRGFFAWDKSFAADYVRVSLPIIAVALMWGLSTSMQTVILGHMKASAIAANSVASTLFMLLKVMAVGASAAAAIVIGKTVGEGRMDKIKSYTKTLQILFLIIGLLMGVGLFLLKGPVLGFYKLSDETKSMADAFLLVLCVTGIGTAYQFPCLCGLIRGGGDTRFVMISDLISVWGIVLPLSFLAAFVFHWPPVAVVCCLNSDQIFKCAVAAIKVNRYKWVKKLTREA